MKAQAQLKIACVLFLCACGAPKAKLENKATFPQRDQCTSLPLTGGQLLVGGKETMEFAPVVLLLSSIEGASSRCTASFIGNELLITAAHCVPKDTKEKVTILIDDCQNKRTLPLESQATWHLGVAGTDFEGDPDLLALAVSDLAILKAPGKPFAEQMSLPSQAITSGDALIAVGYGMEEPSVSAPGISGYVTAKKKAGTITFQKDSGTEPLVSHVSQRGQPALASGDSGGPLLRNKEIIGIASLGTRAYINDSLESTWVNLFSDKAFELLSKVQGETGGLANWEAYKAAYEAL